MMEANQSKDYVDNIMSSSQPVPNKSGCENVGGNGQMHGSRKRHMSESSSSIEGNTCKKIRDVNDPSEIDRVFASARRTLYGQTPQKTNQEYQPNDNQYCFAAIMKKLESLSDEIKTVNKSLTDRIDTLEHDLEKKITEKLSEKMSQAIDKRVNNEMKKVHKSVDERIDTLRADIQSDLETLTTRMNSVTEVMQTDSNSNERSLNLIFRKLPETINENIEEKVNMIIKDHMKVSDVTLALAKRIPNANKDSLIPGVVVATFSDKEHRSKILKAKKNLNKTVYKDVFVHEDQSKEERIASSNPRTLVNAVNRGERVYIRGNRVVNGQHNNQQSAYSGAHNNGTNNQNVQSNRGNMNKNYRGRGQRGRGQGHQGQGHRGNTGRGGNRR